MDVQSDKTSTPLHKSVVKARVTTQSTSKEHKCLICETSFYRREHLKRHTALHTGEKQYQCPCGKTFTRSDALARHLAVCKQGHDGTKRLPKTNRYNKQTRIKRACDHCAKSKSKCDFQDPCSRCCRKSLSCEYAREGYHDPYGSYSVRHPSNTIACEGQHIPESFHSQSNAQREVIDFPMSPTDSNVQSVPTLNVDSQQLSSSPQGTETAKMASRSSSSGKLHNQAILSCLQMDTPFTELDYHDYFEDASSLYLEMTHQFEPFIVPHLPFMVTEDDNRTPPLPSFPELPISSSFLIEEMDPVEAKCIEIRQILGNSEPRLPIDLISTCISRKNLLLCSQLYGKHFQRNFPIIHCPSFKLVEASPILSLAIMLAGACYSEGLLPLNDITKLAMRLLAVIGTQAHEFDMQMPPISTIQASGIITAILVCSRNELASKFVSYHTARNISMVERACFVASTDVIDYSKLTEETFDWQLWVDQETQRRIACEIFCQDMISCVFQGRSPSLLPLEVHLILPCYESCWEAQTASECLQRLQHLPQQMSISTAMRYLRSWSSENAMKFEASGFGMYVLVTALHAVLFQAIQYDMNSTLILAGSFSDGLELGSAQEITGVLLRLQRELSGPTVAALADEAISSQRSSTLKEVNTALNAWRTIWDQRYYRDVGHENRSLSGDPLPLWYLAKLYLVLHCHSQSIHDDSEFAIPRVKGIDEHHKILIQTKIVGWLSKFRRHIRGPDCTAENCLSRLMRPNHDG